MKRTLQSYPWKNFVLQIISPAFLAIALFITTIFAIIIPALERAMVERKKEMIRELTTSAWGVLAECARQEQEGRLNHDQAQRLALAQVRHLRYGAEGKDYFWITDMQPRMVMHPYRSEMDGQDLSNYRDNDGKPLFMNFVKVVREREDGYVDYLWQWKDDPSRIVPKLSYVKGFKPWGWIIGTGIYLEDVGAEIRNMTGKLARISMGISAVIALLILYMARQSFRIERQRLSAKAELLESEAKYRTLVESTSEGLVMALEGRLIYHNQTLVNMLGYTEEEFARQDFAGLLEHRQPGFDHFQAWMEGKPASTRFEACLRGNHNRRIDVTMAAAPISFYGQNGVVITITDISASKQIANELDTSLDTYRKHAAALLIRDIQAADSPETIRNIRARLPRSIKAMIGSGARTRHITRIITAISDAIVTRLIQLTIAKIGAPPVAFAFMALGSEGREELTFVSDQDNAIVYADPPAGADDAAKAYFQQLGEQVCSGLNQAGYPFCLGEAMARNPKWCRPLSEWKRHFSQWIEDSGEQELLDLNIFFDFRTAYGHPELVTELRRHVLVAAKGRSIFLFHLARSALEFKPPVGFFGNIMVVSAGNHPETFNIKSAIVPIVNFSRIYALRYGISDTNTLDRLDQLLRLGVLTKVDQAELTEGYNALMQLRLKHQVELLAAGQEPDNHINPRDLTAITRALLKEIFSQIGLFQSKISLDFTGTT
jgi:PAS domain S-box-containing protein